MSGRNPDFPWLDGKPTHVPCTVADVPDAVILPGDPARVDRFAAVLDGFAIVGQNREFRYGVGWYHDVRIGVCSTGIGGPSTEIAVVELVNLGARRLLRAGGMGALDAALPLGGLVTVARTLRQTGTARVYAPDQDGVALEADAALMADVLAAGDELGYDVVPATVMSTDSYYLGQGRPLRPDGETDAAWIAEARRRGAQGFEMETEALFAVAGRLGVQAAAVLTVHANRADGGWLEAYGAAQDRIVRLAVGALGRTSAREVPLT